MLSAARNKANRRKRTREGDRSTTMTVQNNNTLDPKHQDKKKQALSMRAAMEARNGVAVTLINERLEKQGYNEVAHDKPPHALIQLLKAFNNPFIYVLTVLAVISFFTDFWFPLRAGEETDLVSVYIISAMVALSSLLRFWQEHRSAKSAEALKAMVRTTATCCAASRSAPSPSCAKCRCANWWPAISCSCRPAT
jgi:P-type Mg2+ transporter